MMFTDRQQAGKLLAQALGRFKNDVVVLALPRGGVALGAVVARALHAPLDVVLVRKIGHPAYPEYAIGAVVLGQEPVFADKEVASLDKTWLKRAVADEQQENQRRREFYYDDGSAPAKLKNKTAIIVDDGIATGLTMEAAIRAVKTQSPKRVVVAVPVAPSDSLAMLQKLAEVVVLDHPENFMGAVGSHYYSFPQVENDEVKSMLKAARS